MVPSASLFKPYLLNADNWIQSIIHIIIHQWKVLIFLENSLRVVRKKQIKTGTVVSNTWLNVDRGLVS
jgi:hypothetical protein